MKTSSPAGSPGLRRRRKKRITEILVVRTSMTVPGLVREIKVMVFLS